MKQEYQIPHVYYNDNKTKENGIFASRPKSNIETMHMYD